MGLSTAGEPPKTAPVGGGAREGSILCVLLLLQEPRPILAQSRTRELLSDACARGAHAATVCRVRGMYERLKKSVVGPGHRRGGPERSGAYPSRQECRNRSTHGG